MRLDALLQRLDAQERRLEKYVPLDGEELICDYAVVTNGGDALVPFDDDDANVRITIFAIPSGKFLKQVDPFSFDCAVEYRAAPTDETYLVDCDDGQMLVTRHRIFVAPVLLDPPPEPIIVDVQVADKVVEPATGGGERPVLSDPALFDDKAALAAIIAKQEEQADIAATFRQRPFTSVNSWVQDQLAAWAAIGRI